MFSIYLSLSFLFLYFLFPLPFCGLLEHFLEFHFDFYVMILSAFISIGFLAFILGITLYIHNLSQSQFSSVQFSRSVMSDSLQPHGPQHTRPPCLSPATSVYSNSCPLSQWCHPTISSSVILFSSCVQSFLASGSFPMSQFFASGGQSIAVSASASVLPMNIQDMNSMKRQKESYQATP